MTGGVERQLNRSNLLICVATVVAHLVVAIIRTRDAWFFNDDFQNLIQAAQARTPLSHLRETVFGQYVPLYRATNLLLLNLFGLNFTAAITFLLTFSAAAVAALMYISARMRLPLPATAAIGAFLACMWLPFEGQSWWAAGLHILPGAAFLCGCLAIAARPAQNLTLPGKLALAATYGLGIGFYNALLLVLVPVAVVRWYVSLREQPDLPLARRARSTLADLAPTIAVAFLAVAALLYLRSAGSSSDPLAVLQSVALGVTYGTGAAITGIREFTSSTTGLQLAIWGSVGVAVLAGTTLVSILRARATAWLWIAFWAHTLLQLWIIGGERVAAFGPWILASPRYNLSNILLFVATVILAFGQRWPARNLPPAGATRKVVAAACAVAAIAVVATHLVVGAAYRTPDAMRQAHAFIQAMVTSSPKATPCVGNRTLPNFVTQHWTGAYATLTSFATISPVRLKLTPWSGATHFLADDGRLIAIVDQPTERWTFSDSSNRDVRVLPPIDAAGEINRLEYATSATLVGWASPLIQSDPDAEIVAVTPGRTVIPASHRNLPSPYLTPRFRIATFDRAEFDIDLPQDVTPSEVRVFLLMGRSVAIPIAFPPDVATQAIKPIPGLEAVGDPLTIVSFKASDAFTESGWNPKSPGPPLRGLGFGSYVAMGDAGQGDLSLALDVPAGVTSIAIPFFTGPGAKSLRAQVVDIATRRSIADLADPEIQPDWRLWSVDLPPGFAGGEITVRVEDNSSEWGAWIAVGPIYAKKPAP